jgi:hypothetical protein
VADRCSVEKLVRVILLRAIVISVLQTVAQDGYEQRMTCVAMSVSKAPSQAQYWMDLQMRSVSGRSMRQST